MKKIKKIIIEKRNLEKDNRSQIIIGKGILNQLNELFNFNRYSKVLIVSDNNVAKLFLTKVRNVISLPSEVLVFPAGETQKNILNVQKIWRKLIESRFDRKTLIVNLGGGVTCDLGGFAASTYERGVDFLNIPTTLLAQVDAGIGGKTGINFSGIKNLVGTFDQPRATIIDMETLSFLPKRELISGFMEIIKHGLIADRRYFLFVTKKPPGEFSQKEWQTIIERSCRIKAKIIMKDEKEKDIRKILNFGHTFGHAIESLSLSKTLPLLHGEAVAIGILIEGKISQFCGLISEAEFEQIKKALVEAELPVVMPKNISMGEILAKIRTDKKNFKNEVNWTLLDRIGHAVINRKVNEDIVMNAFRQIKRMKV